VYLALANQNEGERALAYLEKACEGFGVTVPVGTEGSIEAAAQVVHAEAALFATRKVVELAERFCSDNEIELMFVLSYRQASIRSMLDGVERFDQEFVDWLKGRTHAVIDMGEAFKSEFDRSTLDPDTFLTKYYIGHHTPLGNSFTAWTMMETVVDWLDPKPLTYESVEIS
jgi:hypothetical protein